MGAVCCHQEPGRAEEDIPDLHRRGKQTKESKRNQISEGYHSTDQGTRVKELSGSSLIAGQ